MVARPSNKKTPFYALAGEVAGGKMVRLLLF